MTDREAFHDTRREDWEREQYGEPPDVPSPAVATRARIPARIPTTGRNEIPPEVSRQ